MKKLEEAGETDKIAEFKEGAAPALKYIYKNLKDFEFYAGESMNPDGTVSCLKLYIYMYISYNLTLHNLNLILHIVHNNWFSQLDNFLLQRNSVNNKASL